MELRSRIWRAAYRLNRTPLCRLPVSIDDHTFVPPSWDRLVHLILIRWGLMGASDRRVLRDHTREGDLAVDVGANQGVHTLALAGLVGKAGHVYAFEPEFDLHAALERNLERNSIGNVTAIRCALGSSEYSGNLAIAPIHSGAHSLVGGADSFFETQSTKIRRLDTVLGEREIAFVKIDVQGAEPEVLSGMSDVLARSPGIRIMLEFWPGGLQRRGHSPIDFFESLQAMGFLVHFSEPPYRRIVDGRAFIWSIHHRSWINVLLAKKSLTGT